MALESARTRLAIAIAAETKSTPLERWQYYLDTCYEMCRFIRELRRLETAASQKPQAWLRALEVLKKLPVQCEAMRFCRILRDVVEEFGRLEGA